MGTAYGMTDVGLVRTSNEDNFLIDTELGLVMVADGMGGHEGGEIASAGVLTAVRDFVREAGVPEAADNPPPAPPTEADDQAYYDPDATWSDRTMPAVMTLFEAIEFANTKIYARNLQRQFIEGSGMGTTLTGFWQSQPGGPLVVCHVGDSRLYRYRGGELSLLTRDQTLYQQALEAGLLDNLPPRNLLLQAVGPSALIKPDVKPHSLQAGDLYLLCTDGLHGSVPHGVMADTLALAGPDTLEQACASLIAAAKALGSRDNITAVLLACSVATQAS
jgi:protein phosphatase